jgi:hypothetical protein
MADKHAKVTKRGLPQDQLSAGAKTQTPGSSSEGVARSVIEQSHGCRLTDGEWAKQRQRLIEFVVILSRWDRERRRPEDFRNINSELALTVEDRECKTSDQSGT